MVIFSKNREKKKKLTKIELLSIDMMKNVQ
jgi:hypothetical protein